MPLPLAGCARLTRRAWWRDAAARPGQVDGRGCARYAVRHALGGPRPRSRSTARARIVARLPAPTCAGLVAGAGRARPRHGGARGSTCPARRRRRPRPAHPVVHAGGWPPRCRTALGLDRTARRRPHDADRGARAGHGALRGWSRPPAAVGRHRYPVTDGRGERHEPGPASEARSSSSPGRRAGSASCSPASCPRAARRSRWSAWSRTR